MYIAQRATVAIARKKRGVDARALGVLWFGACAVFGPVGCSSTQPGTGAEKGGETGGGVGNAGAGAAGVGNAGDGGADASGGDAAAGGTAGEAGRGGAEQAGEGGAAGAENLLDPPWNEHSQHFELEDCFGFFEGSMAFSADRTELNAAQLLALAGLQRAASNDDCGSDPIDCNVAITDDRGEVTRYPDAFCGPLGQKLSWSSFAPVLTALDCKFAQQDPGVLSPSPGCFNGVAASSRVVHRQLSLPEANRRYHVKVEVDGCFSGGVKLELFGTDPAVALAVSMPGDEPGSPGTCAALDLEAPAPTTADLTITLGAGIDLVDFYVNFR